MAKSLCTKNSAARLQPNLLTSIQATALTRHPSWISERNINRRKGNGEKGKKEKRKGRSPHGDLLQQLGIMH